jgi:hypothetical protein
MLSTNGESQSCDLKETVLPVASSLTESEETLTPATAGTPTKFYGSYSDSMVMYCPANKVAEYLETHASWFSRCAEPMKVQPLGENGYALIIGRFGAFGYEVEPKIGLELLPPDQGIYRIRTIPVPDYHPPGYDVDYQASLQLVENAGSEITHIEWELDLIVNLHFPKFIQRLPKSLIQSTGDRLLHQIVRQVSRRLTRKVQQDFHQSLGILLPGNSHKKQ